MSPHDSCMNHQPLVSIVVRNYNYAQFLSESIDSALCQSYANIEVVVVDDGSTDNSRDVIEGFGQRVIPIFQDNGGQMSAWNTGFRHSNGDIVSFLDSDDVFLPTKIETVARAFCDYPDIGSCFHSLKLVNTVLEPISCTSAPLTKGKNDFRGRMRRGRSLVIPTASSGLSFRRSILEQVFPAMETFGDNYMKFASLWLASSYFLDKPLALQRIHGSNFYTLKHDRRLQARIAVLTGYMLRTSFPEIGKFADNEVAFGLSRYWRSGGIEDDYRSYVREYLGTLPVGRRLTTYLRACGHCILS